MPPYSNPHGGAPPPGGRRSNVLAQPPMSTRILLCALSLPLRQDPLPKSTLFLFQGHPPEDLILLTPEMSIHPPPMVPLSWALPCTSLHCVLLTPGLLSLLCTPCPDIPGPVETGELREVCVGLTTEELGEGGGRERPAEVVLGETDQHVCRESQ